MRTRPILLALSIAVSAVVLSGCTGQASTEKLSYEDSPLAKFFGSETAAMSNEDSEAEALEQSKKVEELVAECMQKEGFEYTPQKMDESMFSSGEEWKTDDREWVAQYGYGMMNFPGSDETVEETVDPNQKYVESLSESEAAAYQEALNGPMSTDTGDEGEMPEYDWKTAGCYGAATHEVYPDSDSTTGVDEAEFEDLFTAMNELYSGLYSDDAPSDIDKKWAACMAEKDYPDFTRQADAQNYISEKVNALWGGDESSSTSDPSVSETPEAEDPGTSEDPAVDKANTPEGKALAEEEITVALADLDCREKTDYQNAQMRKQFEAEEKFIEEHRAELDAYKAALDAESKK